MGANERGQQPVGMFVLEITFHALRAQHPAVDGELFPRFEPDDFVVVNLELNAALHAAETAVRFDERAVLLFHPTAGWFVVQAGAVSFG